MMTLARVIYTHALTSEVPPGKHDHNSSHFAHIKMHFYDKGVKAGSMFYEVLMNGIKKNLSWVEMAKRNRCLYRKFYRVTMDMKN